MNNFFGTNDNQKSLPTMENVMHYSLVIPDAGTLTSNDWITKITQFANQWTRSWIWQIQDFHLTPAEASSHQAISLPESDRNIWDSPMPNPMILTGTTLFGDCIEDEWFIVFLLKEITIQFPGIISTVRDTDGEFLLIEGADALPEWCNPETCENRVFLKGGQLHMVPLVPRTPAQIPHFPAAARHNPVSLAVAINMVYLHPEWTAVSDDLQKKVFDRIADFPSKVSTNVHHARCRVPTRVAKILFHCPQLVAAAVDAFYHRDPISMKACHKMETFHPADSVTTTVKFSRSTYAQISAQTIHPPIPFKPVPSASSPEYPAFDLGMKLACGFEILCTDSMYAKPASSVDDVDFSKDRKWKEYKRKLDKNGYFMGELEGSKVYRLLEQEAQMRFWKERQASIDTKRPLEIRCPLAKIESILTSKDSENMPFISSTPPDSEEWMYVNDSSMQDLLNAKNVDLTPEDLEDIEESELLSEENFGKMRNILDSVKSFMQTKSTVFGAEIPVHARAESDDSDDESEMDDEEEEDKGELKLDFGNYNFDEIERVFWEKLSRPRGQKSESTHQANVVPPVPVSVPAENKADEDLSIRDYMRQMDSELKGTNAVRHTVRVGADSDDESSEDDEEEEEDAENGASAAATKEAKNLSLDLNAVQCLLESYTMQEGEAGPVSNLLGLMGVDLPKIGKAVSKKTD